MLNRKIRKLLVVLLAMALIFEVGFTQVKAGENSTQIKVLSIKKRSKSVRVKVKIINNTKKEIMYGNDFLLYERRGGKWKKLRMKAGYGFDDSLNIILAGKSAKKIFYIEKNAYCKKMQKNKRYMIKWSISGKNKKIKFQL